MINNELLEYIKHQLNNKVSRETITSNLKLTGWLDADVNEAFLALPPVIPQAPIPVSPVMPTVTLGFVQPQIQPQSSYVAQMQPLQQPASSIPKTISIEPAPKGKGKIIFFIIFLILVGVAGGWFYRSQIMNLLGFTTINKNVVEKNTFDKINNFQNSGDITKTMATETYAKYEDSTKGFSFLYPKNLWGELTPDKGFTKDGTKGQFTFENGLKTPSMYINYGGATSGYNINNPNEQGRETAPSDYAQTTETFKKIAEGGGAVVENFVTNSGYSGLKITGTVAPENCEMGCFFQNDQTTYFFELEKFSGGIFFQIPNSVVDRDAVMKTIIFTK